MATLEEALTTLERGHREIDHELARLAPHEMLMTGIGGGEWSAKDLVAHLALWHEIALRTIEEFRSGAMPWIVGVFASPGPGPNDDELTRRAPWPVDRATEAYRDARSATTSALTGLAANEWSAPVPGWTEAPAELGGLLGVVLGTEGLPFGHAFAHLDELRAFVDKRGSKH
jgi:DinB superfamily